MSLYPSLEDMKVDQMIKIQERMENPNPGINPSENLPYSLGPASSSSTSVVLYPRLNDYMGLELTQDMIAQLDPAYGQLAIPAGTSSSLSSSSSAMIAPLSGQTLGLQRAKVTNGIRELVVCKDQNGKIGLRVQAINNGIFICLVSKGSPAALVGLRFGDQILQINGENLAGMNMDKVHKIFKKCPVNGISIIVRDRPFERTVTLHKDSLGHVGFHFKGGKIIGLVKDSSAARNGLLTEHHLLEINGQNVVGLKDKEISIMIDQAGPIITITVIPSFLYDHIIKKMASSLIKFTMDHSIPDV